MTMTDPIADLITRIRNANLAEHDYVEVPRSRIKEEIVKILQEEGFIKGYEVREAGPYENLRVFLKYGPEGEKVITGLKRISKPSLRIYAKKDEIPRVLGGLGIAILSTSQGVMTDKSARKAGIGGEVLCYVW